MEPAFLFTGGDITDLRLEGQAPALEEEEEEIVLDKWHTV